MATLTYDFPCLWFYSEWGNTSCSVIIIIFRPSVWYLVDEANLLPQWLTSRYTFIYIGICSLPSCKHCPHHYVGSYQALSLCTVLCKFLWLDISWCKWKSVKTAFFLRWCTHGLTRVFSKHICWRGWVDGFRNSGDFYNDLSFDLKALVGQWLTGSYTTL